MWKCHEQEIQCYWELVAQGCRDILPWWRDHRLEFPDLSDLARNAFWVMATSAANERVFSIDGHVVNSRRANLKSSSVNDILFFSSALRKKRWRLTQVSHFYFAVFIKSFRWLWNEPLNKVPLAMKNVAWAFSGFQTQSGRCMLRMETVRGRVRRLRVRGGFKIYVCEVGADKKFRPAQDSIGG